MCTHVREFVQANFICQIVKSLAGRPKGEQLNVVRNGKGVAKVSRLLQDYFVWVSPI